MILTLYLWPNFANETITYSNQCYANLLQELGQKDVHNSIGVEPNNLAIKTKSSYT